MSRTLYAVTMSYLSFMPWTLQKRLLRYLLSQLDFLETDDLDLENLGIRWGQRSIVELKNIGLKTRVRALNFPDQNWELTMVA